MDSDQLSMWSSKQQQEQSSHKKGKGQKTMGRGKIEIKKIENITTRQVTFSKRRAGLLKKAHELSVLCDAQVALVIFSSTGKLFEFGSTNIKEILERYRKYPEGANATTFGNNEYLSREVVMLKQQLEWLQQNHKHLLGEDLTHSTLKDLQNLEQQLELGLIRIRARKEQMLLRQIEDLHKREIELHKENGMLRKQVTDTQVPGTAAMSPNTLDTREPPPVGNLSLSFPINRRDLVLAMIAWVQILGQFKINNGSSAFRF